MVKEIKTRNKRNTFLVGAVIFFILFIVYITILIYFIITRTSSSSGISLVIPGGLIVDLVIMFIIPVIIQLVTVFIAMGITPLFIQIAKLMKLGKYPMGVKKIEKNYTFLEFVSRGFYSTLLAITLSLSLNKLLFDLGIEFINGSLAFSSAAMSLVLTPISILIIFPAWFLEDSGIIFMKKENLEDLLSDKVLTNSLDVRGVGCYFVSIIKGFAGITTPILYILLFIQERIFQNSLELGIILIFEPIFLIGSFFFSFWIYLKIVPKIKHRLLKNKNYPEIKIKIEIGQ
ncbi:MAG: hypothetical protein JW776_15775 [Candidatus Lokiarchaeota archaeon]|nr:hypothetical protein [Candidatus Lokiarchaeota archaeon]